MRISHEDLESLVELEYDDHTMLRFLVLSQIRLEKDMTDLTTALKDLNTAIDTDAADKQALKDQVASLQAQIAAAPSPDAALQAAADAVEAAAQKLAPLAPVDTTAVASADVAVSGTATTGTDATGTATTDGTASSYS